MAVQKAQKKRCQKNVITKTCRSTTNQKNWYWVTTWRIIPGLGSPPFIAAMKFRHLEGVPRCEIEIRKGDENDHHGYKLLTIPGMDQLTRLLAKQLLPAVAVEVLLFCVTGVRRPVALGKHVKNGGTQVVKMDGWVDFLRGKVWEESNCFWLEIVDVMANSHNLVDLVNS